MEPTQQANNNEVRLKLLPVRESCLSLFLLMKKIAHITQQQQLSSLERETC